MSETNFLEKALTKTLLTRRSFIKWSAALGGTAALAGGLQYGLKAATAASAPAPAGEQVITAACWHNCGGRCLVRAHVANGVVTRISTDDLHPDSPDYPQQRACIRGRSQRLQVFGADRLKYPMKRANFQPGGGGKKELRGKDTWVRISWDEALDTIASELKRIKTTYGNESIMTPFFGAPRLIAAYGGAWETFGMVSAGAWPVPDAQMAGRMQFNSFGGPGGHNDRLDLRNSKLIVLWGANPAWSSQGSPSYHYLQAKKAGARIISVNPIYTPTAALLADEWIPVHPGTDSALLIGMAYYMITNNLQDQDFLDKYTLGFDAAHMPDGADPKQNFKDYVLGTYDGVPKTPEWASAICGTDPATSRQFALTWATTKPAALMSAFAPARTYRGEQFAQAFLTVGWMTGNVGKPGASVTDAAHAAASNGGPMLVAPGDAGVPPITNPVCVGANAAFVGVSPVKGTLGIVWDEAWDSVINGEFTDGPRGKKKVDIRLIWNIGEGAALNQLPNINQGIAAYRKVDFAVTAGHFLTTPAKYSDIVLPATTQWERYGTILTGNREMMIWASQIVQPMYEAKDDSWIEGELAKRLGLDPNVINPLPLKQQIFNQIAGATVIKADGSGMEPLATITAADLADYGVTGKPQTGRIAIKDLQAAGIYQVPRAPGDNFGYIAYQQYIQDPVANKLPTATGKLQIHSQGLVDQIKSYGWTEVAPVAQYMAAKEGYEDTFSDFANKVKGDYPLQLITPHYMRRSHSIFDNVPWMRAAFPEEFIMNPVDAEPLGIKHGDIVKITSRHGVVIRPAYLTPTIMPGVVALGEGAWAETDDATGIDHAGATNSLSGSLPCGEGVQPWNTNNVRVEKYDGTLAPDYTWPQRIVLKEA
jgi:anaerobic dimethyl sulfoxide reductase subunit A